MTKKEKGTRELAKMWKHNHFCLSLPLKNVVSCPWL